MRPPIRRSLALALPIAAVAIYFSSRHEHRGPVQSAPLDATYATVVQPIFDRRCVPCHACYDSSCQLNLQSFDGLDRGANKAVVYFPQRVVAATPTRMFVDAKTTATWQSATFDFFPVVDRIDSSDPSRSLLWRFVKQRTAYPRGAGFDVDKTTQCPGTLLEVDKELRDRPERGMPFGFPPLTSDESAQIAEWLSRGAGGPAAPSDEDTAATTAATPPALAVEIAKWEDFFDGRDPRTPLVAAYVFEHLYYAHLRFDTATTAWFRLVRSRTPRGAPVDEIPTRRPYDDPGGPFYYRLRRIRETLVEKTHVPYRLNDAKLARLRHLFFDSPWSPASPGAPAYDRARAANPFVAFAAIPARARYQFLLDDALYHVKAFIHGPVCRGEAALDVIDEQFLIFFLAPESDPAVTEPNYLRRIAPNLALPAEDADNIEALSPEFDAREAVYLAEQAARVRPRTLADVWHGDGDNPDAVLSVFRHYDNAFVVRGAVGGIPKTAWIVDYPIFERMYYDLVAGFDVYGNVVHQVATRMYMNLLRIESEGQLLRFLPSSERARVHDGWYRGRIAQALSGIHAKAYAGPEPTIAYDDAAHAKDELVTRLVTRELPAAVVGPREPIQWEGEPLSSDPARAKFQAAMREVVRKPAPYVATFPDVVLLRMKRSDGGDLVYTVARNRSHLSVEFIFGEATELEPAEDTLQIVDGITTSRPNFFLTVDEAHLGDFVAEWKTLRPNDGSFGRFAAKYGARRSDPAFWSTFDFFAGVFPSLDPLGAAVLDLSRYAND